MKQNTLSRTRLGHIWNMDVLVCAQRYACGQRYLIQKQAWGFSSYLWARPFEFILSDKIFKMEPKFQKSFYSVFLDKIILAALWSNVKCLVRKLFLVLAGFIHFCSGKDKICKKDVLVVHFSYGMKYILIKGYLWAQGILATFHVSMPGILNKIFLRVPSPTQLRYIHAQ